MAKLVLLIIKFLTNFQNIGAEWDLGKQVTHITSHFLGEKTKAWRGYYPNHSQSKDLQLFSQLKEIFSDCRSYKWLAQKWAARNVLFDGGKKNCSNVNMGYVSNLLSMYMFNRL